MLIILDYVMRDSAVADLMDDLLLYISPHGHIHYQYFSCLSYTMVFTIVSFITKLPDITGVIPSSHKEKIISLLRVSNCHVFSTIATEQYHHLEGFCFSVNMV